MWSAAVIVACATLLVPTQAGEGEGEGEGEDPCAVVCVDDATLRFCDGDDVVTLACADVDAAAFCDLLTVERGFDCVLPAGSACDPAYAFGRSRCADGLACLDGTCAPGAAPAPSPLEPTPGSGGGSGTATTTTTDFLNCQSCSTSSALWLAPVWLLGRRRRR